MSDPAALSTVVGDRSEPAHGRSTTLDHNIRTAPTFFSPPTPDLVMRQAFATRRSRRTAAIGSGVIGGPPKGPGLPES